MRPRSKLHQTHLFIDIDERHPHCDHLVSIDGPVKLVLMPRRVTAAGFLEQRLVMIKPYFFNTQQIGRDLRELSIEYKSLYRVIIPPKIGDLEKRFAVCVAIFEITFFGRESVDRVSDRGKVNP